MNVEFQTTLAIIKPFGVVHNYGDMAVDRANEKGLRVVERVLIRRLPETAAVKIYKNDFPYLSQLSEHHIRAVLDSITCGAIEVIALEGANSRAHWREMIGATIRPADTLRWHARHLLDIDDQQSYEQQNLTGLDHDRMIVVVNGTHGPKNEAEYQCLVTALRQFITFT